MAAVLFTLMVPCPLLLLLLLLHAAAAAAAQQLQATMQVRAEPPADAP